MSRSGLRAAEAPSSVRVVGARLRSVSRHGMTIESPFALEHGSVLRFRMEVGGEKADVEARVVGCDPGGRRRGFEVRLEFTAVPPAIREALTRASAPPAETAR